MTTKFVPNQATNDFLKADNFNTDQNLALQYVYADDVCALDTCESSSDHGPGYIGTYGTAPTYVTSPAHSGFGSKVAKCVSTGSFRYKVTGVFSSDFTVDFFINVPAVTYTRNILVLSQSGVNSNAEKFYVRVNNKSMYFLDYTTSTGTSSDSGAASLNANTWYHIALTYAKDTKKATLYLNGSKYLEYTLGAALPITCDILRVGNGYNNNNAILYLDSVRCRTGIKTITVPTSQPVLGNVERTIISNNYVYNMPYMTGTTIGGAKATTGLGVNITNAGYLYHTLKGGFGIHCKEFDEEISSTMTPATGIVMDEKTTERVVEPTTVNLWPLNGTLANSVTDGDPFPAVTYEYSQDNDSTLIQSNLSSDLLTDYPLDYATLEWRAKATNTETFTYIGTSETGYGIGFNGTTVKYGSMQSPEEMLEAEGTYEAPKDAFHHFALCYTSFGVYFYYDCKQIGFQALNDPWMSPNYDPYAGDGNSSGLTGHITYGAPFYLHSVKISNEPKYDDETITLDKLVYVSADTSVLATKAEVTAKQADLTTVTGYDATKTQVLKHVNGVLQWVDETPAVSEPEPGSGD